MPRSLENAKLLEDIQYLCKFNSFNFVTYDHLLKDKRKVPFNFYELTDHTPFIAFERHNECVFCQGRISFDSKPVIALLGNLSFRRNLQFFSEFFNKFYNDFNFFVKGNLVDPLDLEIFTRKSERVYFSGTRYRNLGDLYHAVHHLDYLLLDSEKSPEPSGIADLFITYGKGVLVPNESYSFINDFYFKFPESRIVKIDTQKDLMNLNLHKINLVHNPPFQNSFENFQKSFNKIISS
jgi:hypothetical protein